MGRPDTVERRSWEWPLVAVAAVCALGLGLANLGVPSLWHDELVHVYVGKSIAEGKAPQLPSGEPYWNGTTFNTILAGVIRLFGMGETALRAPSVLAAAVNVVLTYWVVRPLFGPVTAVAAAFAVGFSPWTVAWSREARFYTMQQTAYLVFAGSCWRLLSPDHPGGRGVGERGPWRGTMGWAVVALGAYVLAVLTSFHSILFLAPMGAVAGWMVIGGGESRRRGVVASMAVAGAGGLTLLSYMALMNTLDRAAVFERGGLGGEIVDPERALRWYYLHWLWMNHSMGVLLTAMLGFAVMVAREGQRGWYGVLAFWAPILVLTWLIGYRQPRFMFFAFPFYLVGFVYGAGVLVEWMHGLRRMGNERGGAVQLFQAAFGVLMLIFSLRLAWSVILLAGDSFEAASGAHTTLARRHPQWKEPCAYVKAGAEDGVVVTTTFLPVYHYVGRVDNWYPSRFVWWEGGESGMEGLPDLEAFRAYMERHPKGFYLAETSRFDFGPLLIFHPDWAAEVAWIESNLRRVEEASSADVTVFAWGEDLDDDLGDDLGDGLDERP